MSDKSQQTEVKETTNVGKRTSNKHVLGSDDEPGSELAASHRASVQSLALRPSGA